MPTSPATGRPGSPTAVPSPNGVAAQTLADAEQTPAGQAVAEPILLELVDEDGRTIGTAEKLSAHQAPGRLHRAFSVFLFDGEGRLLLQRRALGKYHSPGVWSNTCCGHPYPGEQPFVAAARRTAEELGAAPVLMREAGTVRYNHPDPASGLVEQEYNHLFVGLIGDALRPDPEEIDDTAFVGPQELARLRADGPFSAWFQTVLDAALPTVREVTGGTAGW
ncbi:isopentenyl-diphosphate Delta-isomerase [Streptomyces sp. NPDC088197]|uniref:isopentenyl-diphosphate Delta-isomerase n=1 Tax=unclassified Streptomyces TaxID=2593676 RepID=UPI0033AFE6A2